jgi:hypothetical protein
MKKSFLSSVFVLLAVTCFGQQNDVVYLEPQKTQQPQVEFKPVSEGREDRVSLNVGLLMGGGGLLGADLEFMLSQKLALQFGAGLGSMGGGLNFHFQPYINSQFVSVQYWHQGFGENHYASYLGPMYTFRAKKIFQIGIGFGTILSKGPGWERAWENKEAPGNVALLYNIGLYFPLSPARLTFNTRDRKSTATQLAVWRNGGSNPAESLVRN